MNQMCTQFFKNKYISSFFLIASLFLSTFTQTNSQELFTFNSIAAKAEIDTLNSQLVTKEIDANFLANARVRALQIINNATECIDSSTNERDRLENRFELLRDIDADVSPEISSKLGASFTGLTVTLTVASSDSNSSSLAINVKLSEPLKLGSGV